MLYPNPQSPDDIRSNVYRAAEILRNATRPFETSLIVVAAARLPNNVLHGEFCRRFYKQRGLQGAVALANSYGNALRSPEIPLVALPKTAQNPNTYLLSLRKKHKSSLKQSAYYALGDMANADYPWRKYILHILESAINAGQSEIDALKAAVGLWFWYNEYAKPALKHRKIELSSRTMLPPVHAQIMDGVRSCE